MNLPFLRVVKGSLILLLIDMFVVWLWAINSELGPGSAMVMYLVIPIVLIINIIIGSILFFIKRAYSPLFFINCVVASMVTYWIFTAEMSNQYQGHFDHWSFNLKDTTYRITKFNKYNEFSMSYSEGSPSSINFLDGKFEQRKDTILLTADSIRMFIYNNKLYNFRRSKTPIALKKIDD